MLLKKLSFIYLFDEEAIHFYSMKTISINIYTKPY